MRVRLTRACISRVAAAALCSVAWISPAAEPTAELASKAQGYSLRYPADWSSASKPVKIHLSEELLNAPARGVSLGVTVDPVRIDSLEQFGTADEVAERVVTTELDRDGVLIALLRTVDAQSGRAGEPSYYTVEYEVESSRGKKVYLAKYSIARRKLFVLQTQAPAASYDADDGGVRRVLKDVVASFRVAGGT